MFIDRAYAKRCVGKGWESLIDEFFDLAETLPVTVTQIKEKFGGLRIYYHWADTCLVEVPRTSTGPTGDPFTFSTWAFKPEFEADGNALGTLVRELEERSCKTCEQCGRPGKLRNDRSWLLTLCTRCVVADKLEGGQYRSTSEEEETW